MGNDEVNFIAVIILQVIVLLLFFGIMAMLFIQDGKLNRIIKSVEKVNGIVNGNKPEEEKTNE